MILKNFLQGFTPATEKNFPEGECAIQSKPGIYDSNNCYWCLIFNEEYPQRGLSIEKLKPYIWKDGDESGYGWVSPENQSIFYDNYERRINDETTVVIGFIKDDAQDKPFNFTEVIKEFLMTKE